MSDELANGIFAFIAGFLVGGFVEYWSIQLRTEWRAGAWRRRDRR